VAASDTARDEIKRLLEQDLDELSALLGQSDPEAQDTLYSFDAARDWGEKVMTRLSASLRARICDEWGYCAKRRTKAFNDDVTLAMAVADVILKIIGAFPVSIVATILVKKGLNRFCGCDRD
jgi:hypothetical protein